MNASPTNILNARARLGECPLWDADRQQLFWVDIYNHRVHQFDPATGQDRYFDTGEVVSAIAQADNNQLLVALRSRLAFLDIETGHTTPLTAIEFAHPMETRLNDGKCDPQGRFWIGSCSEISGQAALYRYDPDGSLHLMETELTIANGLGWSPDGLTFYLTDSAQYKIFAYDFEADTGSIHNRRVLVDLSREAVEPDGLAVDAQGNLWSALWDGWAVARFDSSGNELARIKMPVPRPTSVAFGGKSLQALYITSASVELSQKAIQQYYTAGDLFYLPTQATGLPIQSFGHSRSTKKASA